VLSTATTGAVAVVFDGTLPRQAITGSRAMGDEVEQGFRHAFGHEPWVRTVRAASRIEDLEQSIYVATDVLSVGGVVLITLCLFENATLWETD
jgi:hypothetical protein